MRSPGILVVVCAVVLVGAYFASRMLVNDVPAPNPNVVTVVTPPQDAVQPAEPMQVAPVAGRPPVNLEEAHKAMLAPRQGPLQAVNVQQPLPRAVEPVADVAPSPFQGESKELDYAEQLLAETNPPLERLQSAHQVLERCLAQEPDNKRCRAAMTVAQNRLGAKVATERQPPIPTLQAPAPVIPLPK
jgi:hypothetical protein